MLLHRVFLFLLVKKYTQTRLQISLTYNSTLNSPFLKLRCFYNTNTAVVAPAPVVAPVAAVVAVKEEKKEVKVKKFEVNGKKYLKSSENIVYDGETQDVVGKWDEEKKEIIFEELEEEDDEDEE